MGDRPIVVSVWLVARGSTVVRGDAVVEVLCGEATVDLPSPANGVLVEKLIDEDETVVAGQSLGTIEEETDEASGS
jgi:pyruvate/2-oxoglutarate dehydrogenase complex dihydrolipoamide acyltransferase (E2) component